MHEEQTPFENIVGKGEIACNEQFLLFPQCFLLIQIISSFVHIIGIISLFAAEFEEPKIGTSGNGLKSSELEEFEDNIKYGWDYCISRIENIVGKGEIPELSKACFSRLTLYHTILTFNHPGKGGF